MSSILCACNADAIGTLRETELVFQRGSDNFFDFDILDNDLDAGDLIWFRVATRSIYFNDTDAEIVKTRSGGIVDVSAVDGKFQVQLEPADVSEATLPDSAYVFECVIRKVDVSMDTTLARGVVHMSPP